MGLPNLLCEKGITECDVKAAERVLEAIATLSKPQKRKSGSDEDDDGMTAYKHSSLRPLRKALAKCLNLQRNTMYEGRTREEYDKARVQENQRKRQKLTETAQQRKYIETTALRKGRIQRLNEKKMEAQEEELAKLHFMIPDGHVDTNCQSHNLLTSQDASSSIKLPKLRSCYVCKNRFRDLHHFYDQLCPSCAALNWEKRHQRADLRNKVAIVTGSRVKIGFQTCLKLLRCGATVVATTRFPNAAVANYRLEPDFIDWKDRLQVYGLDLRDVTGLEAFCRYLKMQFAESGIDILINNACQTIRRPTGYYLPTCEREEELWRNADKTHKTLLVGCLQFEQIRRSLLLEQKRVGMEEGTQDRKGSSVRRSSKLLLASNTTAEEVHTSPSNSLHVGMDIEKVQNRATAHFESTGIAHSAAMTQVVLLPEDGGVSDSILPPGVSDINGQQLDLRSTNSWLLKMEEVSTPEIMECMFINAIAPFVLNSRLKPLMSTPNDHDGRYIVNVSAMEGKFYRYKMPNHPHSNMAKAALNMMTRTSSEELATKHRIYMNSVDTGWINDENPLEKAHRTSKLNNFQTPIDEIDAAARILDPILSGINAPGVAKDFGKFLKDYQETEW